MKQAEQGKPKSNTRVVATTVGVAIGMVGFVFVGLVPMYNLICDWTGITGRVQTASAPLEQPVTNPDLPSIKVQLVAKNNVNIGWDFYPTQPVMEVVPGQQYQTAFMVKNTSSKDMTAQAVPSIAPFEVSPYFKKVECFCFNQQELAAGESKEMGLMFYLDPEHDYTGVDRVTLSYTLFDISDNPGKASEADTTAAVTP